MSKILSVLALLALAGCSGVPQRSATDIACAAGEATYACQVQRYHDVAQ